MNTVTDQQINDLITRHEVHEYHPGAILEFSRALLALAAPAQQADHTAFALQALVAAGHVTQAKVDEALAIAGNVLPATDKQSLTVGERDKSVQALLYATELAKTMARKHYPDVPQFEVLPDLLGVISQIDNMVCGLVRAPSQPAAQAEPVADFEAWLRTVCFQQPTTEAYDLARAAWRAAAPKSDTQAEWVAREAVGEVAPHPDVVDWYSEEPPVGTKLYAAQAGAKLPNAMSYAAARNWAVTKEWARGFNDARAALAPAAPAGPLTRKQIDDIMTEHYPLDSLLRENVDAFEACVRDIERAHGIGVTPTPHPPAQGIDERAALSMVQTPSD